MQLPSIMQTMVLERQRQPLILKTLPIPSPAASQVLIRIIACGVCRTDLHIIDGELNHPNLPLIIGHEIVGIVVKKRKCRYEVKRREYCWCSLAWLYLWQM